MNYLHFRPAMCVFNTWIFFKIRFTKQTIAVFFNHYVKSSQSCLEIEVVSYSRQLVGNFPIISDTIWISIINSRRRESHTHIDGKSFWVSHIMVYECFWYKQFINIKEIAILCFRKSNIFAHLYDFISSLRSSSLSSLYLYICI